MAEPSIPAMLRQNVNLHPEGVAFKFIDYDRDWDGAVETVTWYQLYRRVVNVARELRNSASPGERVVISAPQSMDYVYAFLGAMQAGLIAVPLSLPQGGATDERVESVMQDASPTTILTTSSAIDDISAQMTRQPSGSAATILEIDRMDLDASIPSGVENDSRQTPVYLQYTSGSTRAPAGVMITYKNLLSNFQQLISGYFAHLGGVPPTDAFLMSWLPFYHDMGLVLGVCAPIMAGFPAVLTSPVAFLQRPARWIQLMATGGRSFGAVQSFSAAPNFAFEVAATKTKDEDLAGFDLSGVVTILSGSERVHPATLKRFNDRFAPFNFPASALRPSYGLAEATVYVATSPAGEAPTLIDFDAAELAAGRVKRSTGEGSTSLVSYEVPQGPTVRIVDPDTCTECPPEAVGEIWVHGNNVAVGYWNRPDETERTFGGRIASPTEGTPDGPWLRTGDRGFVSEDRLYIIGRIKDLLIVYGRNHSPDDIEATIQEVARSRSVALAVPDGGIEKLVIIIEVKKLGATPEEALTRLGAIKRDVTAAVSTSHGLSVADLVLVGPGSIPITTSGKVRRAESVKLYQQGVFQRVDN